jgi:universal stress protein F
MYKHILIPVALDQEHTPDEALGIARRLLEEGGQITALHVVDVLPGYAVQYLPEDHAEQRHREVEKALAAAMGDTNGDVGTAVVSGHAGRAIVDWAADQDVDCIVIASHRPGLQDYFLGSTAARVVRHAVCAVHVLR